MTVIPRSILENRHTRTRAVVHPIDKPCIVTKLSVRQANSASFPNTRHNAIMFIIGYSPLLEALLDRCKIFGSIQHTVHTLHSQQPAAMI